MEFLTQDNAFESYREILTDWLPKGASIAIAIDYTYVYFASGHVNMALRVGSEVPENSIAHQVLQHRKKIDAMMDTTLFETPYYAIGYPIIINGAPAALVVVLPPLFKPEQNILEFITAKDDADDYIPVTVTDIQYIESLQKKTWIYRGEDPYKTSLTLKELQLRLPSNFIRIHRSFIVNLHFITRVSKDYASNFIVHLKNGVELPVSQSYANSLKQLLEI